MEFLEISIAIVAFLTALYFYLTWTFDYWEKQGVKHDRPWPLIGTLKPTWKYKVEQQDAIFYKKYGKIYGTFEGRNPSLSVAEPELIRTIFIKDFQYFPDRRDLTTADKEHFSKKFLQSMDEDLWRDSRQKLSPLFSVKKMKPLLTSMDSHSQSFKKLLLKYSDSKEDVDIKPCISAFNVDSAAAYALGIQTKTMQEPESLLMKSSVKLFTSTHYLVIYLFYLFPTVMKYFSAMIDETSLVYLRKIADNVINQKKAKPKQSNDILDHLMNSDKKLPIEAISAHGILYLAASDVLSTVVSFACYELIVHPEYQERLINEIDDVLSCKNGEMYYEDVRDMEFLDMVVKETLRKYPLVNRLDRKCIKDGYQLNGITLKKGMIVSIPVYSIHHDEEFYPNHDVFNPERFNRENTAKRSPFTFLTFGIGPRNCIGIRLAILNLKLNLIHLFSQFRVAKGQKTPIPLKPDTFGFGVTYLNELYVQVIERKDTPQFE